MHGSGSSGSSDNEETFERTVRWLLHGDPAIRWQTRRDLLDAAPAEVVAERALVATTGWGRTLLDCQDRSGTWACGLYSPKWTSTTYTLLLLRHYGLAPGHPAALRAVEQIWDGARYFGGGLTSAGSIDAPEACVTSMYLALARYFRFDDARVEVAMDWLLTNQLGDGGWNCRTVRFGDRHSSFHTTILALEALAEECRREPDRRQIDTALAKGREFLLDHRLYRSHRDGTVVNPAFTHLSFPPRWHYDVLRGLDHFQNTHAPWDDRYQDALDLVVHRQRSDGTWPVQNKHAGKVWFDMEKTGGPSRWNTLGHFVSNGGQSGLFRPAPQAASVRDDRSPRVDERRSQAGPPRPSSGPLRESVLIIHSWWRLTTAVTEYTDHLSRAGFLAGSADLSKIVSPRPKKRPSPCVGLGGRGR